MDAKFIDKEMTIWILEDDPAYLFIYRTTLAVRYHTSYFKKISSFREALQDTTILPNLIIADLCLEDGNFLEYLSEQKTAPLFGKTPFIVVSFLEDMDVMRFCYSEGSFDYLLKPFKKSELIVKVEQALQARPPTYNASKKDITTYCLDQIELTLKEINILSLFVEKHDECVTREDLLQKVWGQTTVLPKTVDVHLHNLRRKIKPYGLLIECKEPGKWFLLDNRVNH